MSWRIAKSLLTLRQQVDQIAPNRDKSSDGTIGDPAHQARNSDHNPNANGVVTMDITNDPAHGVDSGSLAEMLRISEDQRIKYSALLCHIISRTRSAHAYELRMRRLEVPLIAMLWMSDLGTRMILIGKRAHARKLNPGSI